MNMPWKNPDSQEWRKLWLGYYFWQTSFPIQTNCCKINGEGAGNVREANVIGKKKLNKLVEVNGAKIRFRVEVFR